MIITKPQTRAERFACRTIMPRFGNERMRCGKCGGMDFEAHVTPNVMGTIARVSELVCLGCLKAYKLDGAARLAGSNTVKEPDFESQAPNDIRARAVRESNEQS